MHCFFTVISAGDYIDICRNTRIINNGIYTQGYNRKQNKFTEPAAGVQISYRCLVVIVAILIWLKACIHILIRITLVLRTGCILLILRKAIAGLRIKVLRLTVVIRIIYSVIGSVSPALLIRIRMILNRLAASICLIGRIYKIRTLGRLFVLPALIIVLILIFHKTTHIHL